MLFLRRREGHKCSIKIRGKLHYNTQKDHINMKPSSETQKRHRPFSTKWIRTVILVSAVVLLILGIVQNGHLDVKNKAVRICYECIGIG